MWFLFLTGPFCGFSDTGLFIPQVWKYYQGQAIKQLYVLVLGLDVLGNPYELITGAGEGAKNLFYEPYQGLIQGPEEFAEGLAYGVKSLVGGTVGGVSGAVSRITGTVGKGLAKLTLDEEYQQNRRQVGVNVSILYFRPILN